MDTNLTL